MAIKDLIFNYNDIDCSFIAQNKTKVSDLISSIRNDEGIVGISNKQSDLIRYFAAQCYFGVIPSVETYFKNDWVINDWLTTEEQSRINYNLNLFGYNTNLLTLQSTLVHDVCPFIDSLSCTFIGDDINTIYYTLDGSTPTINSTLYTGEFIIYESTIVKWTNIKPRYICNIQEEYLEQIPIHESYDLLYDDTSSFPITITFNTDQTWIYYTTNGDEPDINSNNYNPHEGFEISEGTIIKWITISEGYRNSPIQTEFITEYTPKSTLSFTEIDQYGGGFNIGFTKDTGVEVYYTIDEITTPSSESTLYVNPFSITCHVQFLIRWIDIKIGSRDRISEQLLERVNPVPVNAVTPSTLTTETISEGIRVTLTPNMSNVTTYYTLDGSDPSELNTLYVGSIDIFEETIFKWLDKKAELYSQTSREVITLG